MPTVLLALFAAAETTHRTCGAADLKEILACVLSCCMTLVPRGARRELVVAIHGFFSPVGRVFLSSYAHRQCAHTTHRERPPPPHPRAPQSCTLRARRRGQLGCRTHTKHCRACGRHIGGPNRPRNRQVSRCWAGEAATAKRCARAPGPYPARPRTAQADDTSARPPPPSRHSPAANPSRHGPDGGVRPPPPRLHPPSWRAPLHRHLSAAQAAAAAAGQVGACAGGSWSRHEPCGGVPPPPPCLHPPSWRAPRHGHLSAAQAAAPAAGQAGAAAGGSWSQHEPCGCVPPPPPSLHTPSRRPPLRRHLSAAQAAAAAAGQVGTGARGSCGRHGPGGGVPPPPPCLYPPERRPPLHRLLSAAQAAAAAAGQVGAGARGSCGRHGRGRRVPPPPPGPCLPSRRPPLRSTLWTAAAAAAAAEQVHAGARSRCSRRDTGAHAAATAAPGRVGACRRRHRARARHHGGHRCRTSCGRPRQRRPPQDRCACVEAATALAPPLRRPPLHCNLWAPGTAVADAGQVRSGAHSRCGRRGPGGGVPPPPQPRLRPPTRRRPLRSNCRTLEVGASAAQLVSSGGRPFRLRQPLPCPRRAARRGRPTRGSPRQGRRPRDWCARARGRLACGYRCRARRLRSRRGLAWHSCARGGGCGGGIGGRGRAVGSPPLLCSQKGA